MVLTAAGRRQEATRVADQEVRDGLQHRKTGTNKLQSKKGQDETPALFPYHHRKARQLI